MKDVKVPVVSVITITYNQEEYIEKTVLSVLNQTVNFEYEYIISDDSTNEKTKEIISKIISEHKNGEKIKYYKNNPPLGAWFNFLSSIEKASGKYIALCEGDDYWIDYQKLQFQYDILQNNNHYSIVMNEICYDINGKLKQIKKNKYLDKIGYNYCSYFKIQFSQTSSFFYRNIIRFPHDVHKFYAGDFILVALCSNHGNLYYDKKIRTAYRLNANNSMTKKNSYNKIMFYKNQVAVNFYLSKIIDIKYLNCLTTSLYKLIFLKFYYKFQKNIYNWRN